MPPRQNAICWEKSGNTVLLISCPSLYPYHSRLAMSNSAGLAAFEDGAPYRCYCQMRNLEFSEGRMEIYDEIRSGRPSVSDGVVEKIGHPPYSPDLAPSDYHLFPKLQEHLGGQRFSTDDEVKKEVRLVQQQILLILWSKGQSVCSSVITFDRKVLETCNLAFDRKVLETCNLALDRKVLETCNLALDRKVLETCNLALDTKVLETCNLVRRFLLVQGRTQLIFGSKGNRTVCWSD
ncbi:hypothetical protein J6590_035220 [Homalodisca vitripennis]|nr:hypothetical protein J6590_035220 [Homalodisca vitripennis]